MSKKQGEEQPTQKKVVGYLRVSTVNQDLEKNKADILTYANDHRLGNVDFVEEVVSGKVSWKLRKIKDVIDSLEKDDWLIVAELSRLGRSMLEIMEIISEAKGRRSTFLPSRITGHRTDHRKQDPAAGLLHGKRNREGSYQRKDKGSVEGHKGIGCQAGEA
jgi:hypothetical protein